MKTFIKILLLNLFLFSFLEAKYEVPDDNPLIKMIANQINKTLPKKLDRVITLDSVHGVKNRLVFKGVFSESEFEKVSPHPINLHSLGNEELDSFKKGFITRTHDEKKKVFCINRYMRDLLDSGIDLVYNYHFKSDNSLIGVTVITSNSCKLEHKTAY